MKGSAALEAGERVLLIDEKGRRYMTTLRVGRQFHTHQGIVDHDMLIGSSQGTKARSSGGGTFLVLRPTLADFMLKMHRGAQVVYPKDVALIVMYGDVFPGARVLEAGSGSGSLLLGLARAAGPTGKVVSYEIREDHHRRATANLTEWHWGKLPAHVELRVGDVFEEVLDEVFDRVVFDLPEPWRALDKTLDSLIAGGIVCCYLPTVPQVQETAEALRQDGFLMIETFEALLRTWNVAGRSVRPDHRMVAHTGFIITARKPTNT